MNCITETRTNNIYCILKHCTFPGISDRYTNVTLDCLYKFFTLIYQLYLKRGLRNNGEDLRRNLILGNVAVHCIVKRNILW